MMLWNYSLPFGSSPEARSDRCCCDADLLASCCCCDTDLLPSCCCCDADLLRVVVVIQILFVLFACCAIV